MYESGDDYIYHNMFQVRYFEEAVMSGEWEFVIDSYREDKFYQTLKVKDRGTALHVAVSNGEKKVVEQLVEVLKNMWNDDEDEDHPLRIRNEIDCTALHIAAYRGFITMCECIIGKNGERKSLLTVKNYNGETPLFWAVLGQQKTTFLYLHHFFPGVEEGLDLVKDKHGNTILHVAIWREIFDLASIIMYYYGSSSINSTTNEKGSTPLKVLATKSSAFENGNYLSWWEKILYHCFPLKLQDTKTELESLQKNIKKGSCLSEAHFYSIYCTSIRPGHIAELDESSIQLKDTDELEKQDKVQSTFDQMSEWPILSLLGLKKIKIIKRKHLYARRLLMKFMENYKESYWGTLGGGGYVEPFDENHKEEREEIWKIGGNKQKMEDMWKTVGNDEDPQFRMSAGEIGTSKTMEDPHNETKLLLAEKIATKDTIYLIAAKHDILEIMQGLISKPITSDNKGILLEALKNIETKLLPDKIATKEESTYLVAAKHGIVEITREIESKIKSVIHDRNSNNENVLLLAVKYRQPQIVEELRNSLIIDHNIFKILSQQVDIKENTMLHLAAYTSLDKEQIWTISGPAMQMMWDIKWYKYIKSIVPEHFKHRINTEDKTPSEIFKEQHKELLNKSLDWLKDTAQSCSAIATLIAGLSFATSSGGNDNSEKPALEGQPAFEGSAISSLIGLYSSGIALIMFLAILTSRKQINDFDIIVPTKLLVGLTSLFVSIVAMFISFCAGHFFVLADNKYGRHDILVYLLIVFTIPLVFYGIMQLPFYIELVKVIWKKVPPPSIKGIDL